MVKPEHIVDFLREHGLETFPYSVNRITAEKDRHLLITQIPGLQGFGVEGLLDAPGFQFRVRAPRDDSTQAEDDIETIDNILLDETLWPFRLGDHHVLGVGRQGGPPTYFTTDHQNRVSYVCNYWLQASRLAAY
jgi:hypothetical protein